MAISDAKKRANARWTKANMTRREVAFSPNEQDLLEHLDAQPNKAGYLKNLIRKDMERRKDD